MVNSSFEVVSKLFLVLFENNVEKIRYTGCHPQKLEKKITRLRLIVDFFLSAMRHNFGKQVNIDITETAPGQQND